MTKLVVFCHFRAFSRFLSILTPRMVGLRNAYARGCGRGLIPKPEAMGGT